MTNHKLARILKQLSDILYLLPDNKFDETLKQLQDFTKEKISSQKKPNLTEKKRVINQERLVLDKLLNELRKLTQEEAKIFLENHPEFTKSSTLNELAKKLNITSSRRSSKVNLIHTILKYLERENIDKTIRSRSKFTQNNQEKNDS